MSYDLFIGDDGRCCFADNVTGTAFGPIYPSIKSGEEFEKWLKINGYGKKGEGDPRTLTLEDLRNAYNRFIEDVRTGRVVFPEGENPYE
jgi:hypothetical protein